MKIMDPLNPFTIDNKPSTRPACMCIGGLTFFKIPAGSATIGRNNIEQNEEFTHQALQIPQRKIFIGEYWMSASQLDLGVSSSDEVDDFCDHFFEKYHIPITAPSEIQWEKAMNAVGDEMRPGKFKYEWTSSRLLPYIGSPIYFPSPIVNSNVVKVMDDIPGRYGHDRACSIGFRPIISCSVSPNIYGHGEFKMNQVMLARVLQERGDILVLDIGQPQLAEIEKSFFEEFELNIILEARNIVVMPVRMSELGFICIRPSQSLFANY